MHNLVDGHSRRTLFSEVGTVTQGGSHEFGQFDVNQYSRLTGLLSFPAAGATGITFQWRMGINSGTFEVTSNQTGISTTLALDETNHGIFADFTITSVDSTTAFTVLVLGEPLR